MIDIFVDAFSGASDSIDKWLKSDDNLLDSEFAKTAGEAYSKYLEYKQAKQTRRNSLANFGKGSASTGVSGFPATTTRQMPSVDMEEMDARWKAKLRSFIASAEKSAVRGESPDRMSSFYNTQKQISGK